MQELYNMGISENTIKCMIEITPNLVNITEREIKEKEIILESIGCSKSQILNVISSNSMYLDRTNDEIIKLINSLKQYGFENINILVDSNPYILNLEPYEIKNYIDNRLKGGESIDSIIDELELNTILFNEM